MGTPEQYASFPAHSLQMCPYLSYKGQVESYYHSVRGTEEFLVTTGDTEISLTCNTGAQV